MALKGKPVRCSGLVPGVTMLISSGGLRPQHGGEAESLAADVWALIAPKLTEWLQMLAPPAGVTMRLADLWIEIGWDARTVIAPGAMDVVVTHEPSTVTAYTRQRRQRPLIERSMTAEELHDRRWSKVRHCLIDAMFPTRAASAQRLARLPGLVRYRVTGAMAAWHAWREAVDALLPSQPMTETLKAMPIPRMMRRVQLQAKDLLPIGAEGFSAFQIATAASYSAVWLAFEVRSGIFYEPTPPLHRLLDAAYIADDVPIGMLSLPVETLCIIPEPGRWGRPKGVEAIGIFRYAQSISFVAWMGAFDENSELYMEALNLPTGEPDKTLRQLIDEEFGSASSENEQAKEIWRNALDYALKMLLYLNARDAQVVHDRAYSSAPRDFNGLGKRRRVERLAEIDMLYDKHIVGPAILDMAPVALLPPDCTEHREVRGHWRRPHFKMQPHGPNASLRKLVFIGPTIVRSDRLGL
ncbi:hypothetical protein WKR88_28035 [Trinickia caryophylli]|nr:hypothetical protein [Trinickia caryophylli]WQE13894.1 hypothetical protein U0034_24535 [Trinickia caryophylli]